MEITSRRTRLVIGFRCSFGGHCQPYPSKNTIAYLPVRLLGEKVPEMGDSGPNRESLQSHWLERNGPASVHRARRKKNANAHVESGVIRTTAWVNSRRIRLLDWDHSLLCLSSAPESEKPRKESSTWNQGSLSRTVKQNTCP